MSFQRIRNLFNNQLLGQLVIQLTDQCNATCPQCGMRRTEKFPRSTLELDEVKRIIDSAAAKGVESYPCRGGLDFFFVDSKEGNTYPCGYRGDENLGKYSEVDINRINKNSSCRECDWECFRDPSELLGPLIDGFRTPVKVIRKFISDPVYFRYWLQDIRYYRACNFFDGREPPNYRRLSRFSSKNPDEQDLFRLESLPNNASEIPSEN